MDQFPKLRLPVIVCQQSILRQSVSWQFHTSSKLSKIIFANTYDHLIYIYIYIYINI